MSGKNHLFTETINLTELRDRLIGLQTQLDKSRFSLDLLMGSETVEDTDKKIHPDADRFNRHSAQKNIHRS